MQKEIKDAYPKKVCHMLRHVKKKEGKKKIAPYPKRKKKERWCIQKEFVHHPPKKYQHTCTSWSRFMTCFSFGSGLRLREIWEAGMPSILHTYSSTDVAIRDRLRKKGIIKNFGKDLHTLSDPRDHPRNFINFFWKLYKTSRLTVELNRKKYEHSMIPFWLSTAKDEVKL